MVRQLENKRSPTLVDVAELAGVSAITVSRALRTPEKVSASAREKVTRAVAQLGYVPNPAASALASRRTDVIGLLVPSLTNNVFAEVLRGIYDGVAQTSYGVQIGNYRYAPAGEERLIGTFLSQKPAGLIVAGTDQTEAATALLRSAPCPVVQIMDMGQEPVDMSVGLSHELAAADAVRHLLEQGYQRPAFLGARMDPRSLKRQAGFRETAEAAGVFDLARVVTTPRRSSVGLGGELLRELLDRTSDADCVLCNNDDLAAGALFEAQRLGVSVPGDLGICGFNDLEMSRYLNPSLTSVATHLYEIGAQALNMMCQALDDKPNPMPVRELAGTVVARGSTDRRGLLVLS